MESLSPDATVNETHSLVQTADGTWSCVDESVGELCHNRVGAYAEALSNYTVASGALQRLQETGELRLLDACYGMGYNTWVLINEAVKTIERPLSIQVTAVETSPKVIGFLPLVLDHPSFDTLKNKIADFEHNIYYRTLQCLSNTNLLDDFSIHVAVPHRIEVRFLVRDLRRVLPELDGQYDLVFHDPFSPQKMPELWSADIFRHYARLLHNPEGKILTYSAAASVRGGLLEAGFSIGRTEALGAKSGGTVASFLPGAGIPLNGEELAYINTKAGIPFRDAQLTLERSEILANRAREQAESDRPPGNSIRQKLGNKSPK